MAGYDSLSGFGASTPLSGSNYNSGLGAGSGNWLTGNQGDSIFGQLDSMGLNTSDINTGILGAGQGGGGLLGGVATLLKDSDFLNAAGGVGSAIADLGGVWAAMESLDLSKKAYKDSSKMSEKNYAAQRQMTNANLEAQQRARLSGASAAQRANMRSVDEQMAKYGVAA